MLSKREIIEKFLFEGNIGEQKEKFEIAWDIRENLYEIEKEMRRRVLATLVDKIRNSEDFSDYEIKDDGLLKGQKWSPLRVYKKNWFLDIGIPLSCAIEAGKNNYLNLYFGIVKWNNDKGIPFKGDWQKQDDIEQKLLNNINQIYNILGGDSKGWKVASEWWIVWKHLDSFYRDMRQREFYLQIIMKNGLKKAINYFFDELLKLKNDTEKYLDEIVHIYLNQGE